MLASLNIKLKRSFCKVLGSKGKNILFLWSGLLKWKLDGLVHWWFEALFYDWWSVVDTIWGLIPIFAAYFKDISPKLLVYCTLAHRRVFRMGEFTVEVTFCKKNLWSLKMASYALGGYLVPLDYHDFTLPETNSKQVCTWKWMGLEDEAVSGFGASPASFQGGTQRITMDF